MLMTAWIGTSGFQYEEWKGEGKFYPEKLSKAKMLTYYAEHFNSTESNYTFRSIPSEKTIKRWVDETPEDFRWSPKAPQRVTHFSKLRDCGELVKVFHEVLSGLGEKLGVVLFQLPGSFKADVALLSDFMDELPKGMRAAFEFRHESWFSDEVYDALSAHNVALCLAESEELKTPDVVTANFGYLRPRRLDYSAADIKKLAKFLSKQREAKGKTAWKEAFVYFKHEETCVGPVFAEKLKAAMA